MRTGEEVATRVLPCMGKAADFASHFLYVPGVEFLFGSRKKSTGL
jgi:hypothetical protein